MEPHISFLDRFANSFNRGEEEVRIENRRRICGVNNLLHIGDPASIQVQHLEAEHVHIYSHKKGYYEPELEFLRKAFDLLRIKYEYHEIDYPQIGYGELPLLRIEFMMFTKQHFVDVVFKVLNEGTDLRDEITNNGIIHLCKELEKITNYFMWSAENIHYKYRSRYWLLFQPIWRSQELYGNFKKRVALSQHGVESFTFAIEKAKELLDKFEKILTEYKGFYLGDRQANQTKAQIMDLLVYNYFEEIIRNTVRSQLYDLFIEKHSALKRFTEDFNRSFHDSLGERAVGPSVKLRFAKPDLVHNYQSRYKTVEEKKKEQSTSVFLTVTSISLLLYIYIYHKG